MGILSIFKRKQQESNERHELNELDRNFSIERRKINAELRRTRQDIEIAKAKLQLQELNNQLSEFDDDEDEEDTSNDDMFSQMLTLLKGQPQQINANSNANTPPNIAKIELSQEQIEALYKENKQYVKMAKMMTDEQIKAFILNRMPDLSDNSISQIISRVRR